VLLLIGLGFTVVLAILGSREDPTSPLAIISLVVAAGIFQVMSVLAGARARTADPVLVKNLTRQLLTMAKMANVSVQMAESDLQNKRRGEDPVHLGELSVHLSY
jgi:hypothetical protein